MTRSTLAFALVLLLAAPSAAQAQSEPAAAEPTAAQIELNRRAIGMLRAQQFNEAIDVLYESIALGELNITWLNLGRALMKVGRCGEAREALLAIPGSPLVSQPPPDAVAEATQRFRAEMDRTCTGFIALDCTPAQMSLTVDGRRAGVCPAEPLRVDAGTITIVGSWRGATLAERVRVSPGQTIPLKIDLRPLLDDPGPGLGETPDKGGQFNGTGWLLTGLGLGAIGGGVALDLVPASSQNFTFEALDLAPAGLYIAGTGLLLYGMITLFSVAEEESPKP